MEESSWNCSTCTFSNHEAIKACEICGTPKQGGAPAVNLVVDERLLLIKRAAAGRPGDAQCLELGRRWFERSGAKELQRKAGVSYADYVKERIRDPRDRVQIEKDLARTCAESVRQPSIRDFLMRPRIASGSQRMAKVSGSNSAGDSEEAAPPTANPDTYGQLSRVLMCFVKRHTSIGYTQGMDQIVLLLLAFQSESQAFWTLCVLVERLRPRDFYTQPPASMNGYLVECAVLCKLAVRCFPDMRRKVGKEQLARAVEMVAAKWLVPLYLDSIDLTSTLLIWDHFFSDEHHHHALYTAAMCLIESVRDEVMSGQNEIVPALIMRSRQRAEGGQWASLEQMVKGWAEPRFHWPSEELAAMARAERLALASRWNTDDGRLVELLQEDGEKSGMLFTRRQLRMYRDAFQVLVDNNGQGITREQLCALLHACSPLPQQLRLRLFDLCDRDGSGWVDFQQLICGVVSALMLRCEPEAGLARREMWFKLFDSREAGMLSKEDLGHMATVMTEMGLPGDKEGGKRMSVKASLTALSRACDKGGGVSIAAWCTSTALHDGVTAALTMLSPQQAAAAEASEKDRRDASSHLSSPSPAAQRRSRLPPRRRHEIETSRTVYTYENERWAPRLGFSRLVLIPGGKVDPPNWSNGTPLSQPGARVPRERKGFILPAGWRWQGKWEVDTSPCPDVLAATHRTLSGPRDSVPEDTNNSNNSSSTSFPDGNEEGLFLVEDADVQQAKSLAEMAALAQEKRRAAAAGRDDEEDDGFVVLSRQEELEQKERKEKLKNWDGWWYAIDFSQSFGQLPHKQLSVVRRRRWKRTMNHTRFDQEEKVRAQGMLARTLVAHAERHRLECLNQDLVDADPRVRFEQRRAAERKRLGLDQKGPQERTVVTFENQRWWPMKWCARMMPNERAPWSDATGHHKRPRESFVAPVGWSWVGPWHVESSHTGHCDKDGWEYAIAFSDNYGPARDTTYCRRRKWTRTMRKIKDFDSAVHVQQLQKREPQQESKATDVSSF